jgi:tyrosine-protein phosphatase YwqE
MSIFSNIFGSSNKNIIKDFSELHTDMHSHMLPGIDDGAKTIEDSIKMIKAMQALGYKKIITSPHVMGDFYRNTTEIIQSKLQTVRTALQEQNIDMEIDAVAEYYLDENFIQLIKKRDLLTFGKNYVLFELSYINKYTDVLGVVFDLKMAGYKPVLAHPERYNYMHDNFKEYEELYDFEVYFQLNLATFAGHYGPQAKEIAYKLMKNKMVDFIGSDAHHNGHIRLYDKCLQDKQLKELLESGNLKNIKLA